MEARYIKGLPWEEIALEMRYSAQMIHRIHRGALLCLNSEGVAVISKGSNVGSKGKNKGN